MSFPAVLPSGVLLPAIVVVGTAGGRRERQRLMERLGDRYLVGDPLGGTAVERVFTGELVESAAGPGRTVAVRLVDHRLATAPGAVDQLRELVGRIRGIGGPHLAAVHDVVVDGDRVALISDPLPPTTLRDWLNRDGSLYPALVAQLGAEIASALELLHGRGVLHLALVPENVRIDGSATVTGQGVGPVRVGVGSAGRDAVVSAMPHYVAPEIIRGAPLDHGVDMYALGALLYEACCGVPPFVGPLVEVLAAHRDLRPGVLTEVPRPLRALIEELLAKDPAQRPDATTARIRLTDLVTQISGVHAAPARRTPPVPIPIPLPGVDDMAQRRRRRRLILTSITAAVVVGVATTLFVVSGTEPQPVSGGERPVAGAGASSAAGTTTKPTTSTTPLATTMPELVGTDIADARPRLPSGVAIETILVVGDEDEDGVIRAQEPAAGEPIGDTVRLTVARPLVPVQLDTLDVLDGGWGGQGVATMNGNQFLHSLSSAAGACSRDTGFAEYNLGRTFRTLRADVGFDDESKNERVVVELEVVGDGRPLKRLTVAFGPPVALEVDVAEVLRLRIQWQVTSDSNEIGCNYATLSLGDPRLYGFAEQPPSSGASTTPYSTSTPPTN